MAKLSLYAVSWRAVPALLLIAASTAAAQSAPCAACVLVSVDPGQTLALPPALNGLEVLVRVASGEEAGAEPALTAIAAAGGKPGLLFEVQRSAPDAIDALTFSLKTRLTNARAARPDVRLAIAGVQEVVAELQRRDIGPYADLIVEHAPEPLTDIIGVLKTPVTNREHLLAYRLPDDVLEARRVLADLAGAARWLVPALVAGGTADVRCAGRSARTFLDPRSMDTIALAERCAPTAEVTVVPAQAPTERFALSTGDLLVRVPAAEGRYAEDVGVIGSRQLTVHEIIARHQAASARQRTAVAESISSGTMTLTFEAPGFPAPVAITSEAIIYTDRARTEIEQRDVRVNGIAFKAGGVPRLPIIEPERAASPPLAIALTDLYRYSLGGQQRIGNTLCYVVTFEPAQGGAPLYRGRAWIAADTFAMVRVAAAQTGLRGPIVSSEQVDEFRDHGQGLWLLSRSEVRQLYEGAAHRTPIHRVLAISRHDINPPDFAERRAAAYASPTLMLRDTPQGYRYLRRNPSAESNPQPAEPAVAARADRVRTLALGVIIDPNISRPLPFAGLSYVDFNLLDSGAQLNAFFGGTYGQLAFSVSSLGGTRWQLAGRAFGIATSYNDRAFVAGREIYAQNIRQRPAHASTWLLRPLTPRITLRAGYELDYTHFGRNDLTSLDFTVPADQLSHAARLALEGQRAGWTASLWWAPARRSGWRAWGYSAAALETERTANEFQPSHRDFQRYGATIARSVVISPRLVGRLEAAWMGGSDLDRFSRYTFGTFDNRLRGYPSALIRYNRGGVLRTAAAWAAGRLLRVDGFFDSAYVVDPGFGGRFRSYTGVGGALEAPAPFGTLVAAEWGYGFQGVKSNGRRGTQVVRITGYKIF